jgi:NAD(P)-dependent dehydrogenase (short-subunit alcohol dehydrogenase family)
MLPRRVTAKIIVDAAVERFGRLDILVNNAGRGMKYVSDSFMTEPSRFWEISLETVAVDYRHERQRAVTDGTNCSARDDQNWLGTHHQHLREPRDHAPPRIFALWSVKGCA